MYHLHVISGKANFRGGAADGAAHASVGAAQRENLVHFRWNDDAVVSLAAIPSPVVPLVPIV